MLFAQYLNASPTNTISIDPVLPSGLALSYPNESNKQPLQSEFKLLQSIFMSNRVGERWAVITVKNTASGNRSLEHKHLMAIFADGQRHSPEPFKINVAAQQARSITVYFGQNQFPLLVVNTAN